MKHVGGNNSRSLLFKSITFSKWIALSLAVTGIYLTVHGVFNFSKNKAPQGDRLESRRPGFSPPSAPILPVEKRVALDKIIKPLFKSLSGSSTSSSGSLGSNSNPSLLAMSSARSSTLKSSPQQEAQNRTVEKLYQVSQRLALLELGPKVSDQNIKNLLATERSELQKLKLDPQFSKFSQEVKDTLFSFEQELEKAYQNPKPEGIQNLGKMVQVIGQGYGDSPLTSGHQFLSPTPTLNETSSIKESKPSRSNSPLVNTNPSMASKAMSSKAMISSTSLAGAPSVSEESVSFPTCTSSPISDVDPSAGASHQDLFTERSTSIVALASELKTPAMAFKFVRDEISFSNTYGASQTAEQVLKSRTGSSADKASLLIALLRAQNIPAYYVTGEIQLSVNEAKKAYGVVGDYDLYWTICMGLFQYYQMFDGLDCDLTKISTSSAASSSPNSTGGERILHLPETWVRAQINHQYQNHCNPRVSRAIDINRLKIALQNG